MRAKVVVFPVRGRNWCFSTSVQPSASDSASSLTPSTFKDLFSKISFSKPKPFASNAELLVDFVANKVTCLFTTLCSLPFYWYLYVCVCIFVCMVAYINVFHLGLFRWIKLGWVWRRRLKGLSKTRFTGRTPKYRLNWYMCVCSFCIKQLRLISMMFVCWN